MVEMILEEQAAAGRHNPRRPMTCEIWPVALASRIHQTARRSSESGSLWARSPAGCWIFASHIAQQGV
jgi:hypothetical protein